MNGRAYYNEIDPFCCAWLRNLIAAGQLPDGEVDGRDIRDVQPEDLNGFDDCHFFAGIGGWPLAVRLAGYEGGGGRIWTASCPCQPFSFAGRAGGVLDERHLWPAFRRLLPERALPTLLGEQVASAAGRAWLSGIRLDLEALGYAFGAADLPAACVGAPHNRARLWWGATHPYTAGQRQQGRAQRRSSGLFESQKFERVVEAILQHSSPGRGSSLVDGVRHRTPKLRAYGNAIVPWVGVEFIQAVMECRP